MMTTGERRNTLRSPQEERRPKRGRPGAEDRQVRARYVLRHLDDPIDLGQSPRAARDVENQVGCSNWT